jgi:hypothetical protein
LECSRKLLQKSLAGEVAMTVVKYPLTAQMTRSNVISKSLRRHSLRL